MYFPIVYNYLISSLEEAIYISTITVNEKNKDIELIEL